MELKILIFSNELKHRVLRHILFWVGRFCVVFVDGQGFVVFQDQGLKKIIQWDLLKAFLTILPQVPFCYFILYFLIPNSILRKKYVVGATAFITSILIFYWMLYAYYWMMNAYVLSAVPNFWAFFGLHSLQSGGTLMEIALGSIYAPSGLLVSCSLMCTIKFLKIWYVKEQENLELARENGKAELQLLKAQVHPHFLFNTLNNIYSLTLTKSPMAVDLIDRLFGILHFMILEGKNALVPLQKEIKLIQDYISLEKVRYGHRLNICVDIKGDLESKFIAPLLLIPFVENSFKHGSSKMLAHPKLELSIIIDGLQLIFMLKNNKPNSSTQEGQSNRGGIGLKNVAKRLQLLYPDNHCLKIESTDTNFIVYMHILLKEMKAVNLDNSPSPDTQQTLSYASP
jgi:sensor histidine kinase YesM